MNSRKILTQLVEIVELAMVKVSAKSLQNWRNYRHAKMGSIFYETPCISTVEFQQKTA